ncbi:hypothetical protein JCM10295v2_000512 [Rhodotorula toruloides]
MDASVLYLTLALALFSFFCSTYTTLRTLLPLLPDHPLNRRTAGSAIGSFAPAASPSETTPRLKSAQRFAAYLSVVDIFAAVVLVWEMSTAVSGNSQLGDSKLAAARIYLATTARPTLLLVVAILSYTNVCLGRSIALGKADSIVWAPALAVYAVGGGLAALPKVGGSNVWIGLISWLSLVTAVVTVCFGRLLVAILRDKMVSPADLPYGNYLSTFHNNFSGLSTSFVNSIGRSSSTINLPTQPKNAPSIFEGKASTPSRASAEDGDFDYRHDFRSPTPGSTYGLIDQSASALSGRSTPQLGPRLHIYEDAREILDYDKADSQTTTSRRSMSSIASRASTYLSPGGLVAGSAVRNAVKVQEAWGGQTPPGTGHSPAVELSSKEARGALIRIGGHLASCLLGYAFVAPFVISRLVHPSGSVPLVASLLLVIGVCQPGVILAWQCWSSEGFWFRRQQPPIPKSSSALALEKLEVVVENEKGDFRVESRASTVRTYKDSLPGIVPDGVDCNPTQRGKLGRAISMLEAHPKLQLLPSPTAQVSITSAVQSASTGHARLRSLKLSKATTGSFGETGKTRPRTGSGASRKTVCGFEHHARHVSAPLDPTDTSLIVSLLKAKKRASDSHRQPSRERIPFGFKDSNARERPASTGFCSKPPLASPSFAPSADFNALIRELTLSSVDSRPHMDSPPPVPPLAQEIDYLSAQVLPKLVPSIKLGNSVTVASKNAPPPRPPWMGPAPIDEYRFGSFASRRSRLSGRFSFAGVSKAEPAKVTDASEVWVSVDTPEVDEELSPPSVSPASIRADKPVRLSSPTAEHLPHGDEKTTHTCTASSGTRLDISFEWEDGASEVLDAGTLADDSSSDDNGDSDAEIAAFEAHRRARQALPPLSPTFATSISQGVYLKSSPSIRHPHSPNGSVVLRGSQVFSEEEDVRTGRIQCATVRPISRQSDSSSTEMMHSYGLRSTHVPVASVTSSRSFASLSSLTSQGFHNMMASQSWHGGNSDSALSSDEQQRRSQPNSRPLSLLSQRDVNVMSSDESSERELQKVSHHRAATGLRDSNSHSALPRLPLPPIPAESDEDHNEVLKTPTLTPSNHQRRPSRTPCDVDLSKPTSATSSSRVPARTPPNATSRSRARAKTAFDNLRPSLAGPSLRYLSSYSPTRSSPTEAPTREYFYDVDVHGQLFLSTTKQRNVATAYRDPRFLSTLYTRIRRNLSEDERSQAVRQQGYEFQSDCMGERNWVRPDRDGTVLVFQSLEEGELHYGGSLTTPFNPATLRVDPESGYLFHPSPLPSRRRAAETSRYGPYSLLKSSLVLEHFASSLEYDDDGRGSFEYQGKRFDLEKLEECDVWRRAD